MPNPHNIQQYVNVVFSAKGQQQVLQYAEQMLKASKDERAQVLASIQAIKEKGEALTKDEQDELKRLGKLKEALDVQVKTYETAKTKGTEAFNARTKGLMTWSTLAPRDSPNSIVNSISLSRTSAISRTWMAKR